MASPSGRKDGLRCGCDRLLLEKDPEMGLGVRCGRRECDKFHLLEEINQRAVKFKKQRGNPKEEKMVDSKTPSKTKTFDDLITLGLNSGDSQQVLASQYAQSLNFDIDRIEKILGFSLTVHQFTSVELSLCSARIDGLRVNISIEPFNGQISYNRSNFFLTVSTFKIDSEKNEYYDRAFFIYNGLLRHVICCEEVKMVQFEVENPQGTATLVELHKDQMKISVVGREKYPRLVIAEFYIDQLSSRI